jgi:hypothetical protein
LGCGRDFQRDAKKKTTKAVARLEEGTVSRDSY